MWSKKGQIYAFSCMSILADECRFLAPLKSIYLFSPRNAQNLVIYIFISKASILFLADSFITTHVFDPYVDIRKTTVFGNRSLCHFREIVVFLYTIQFANANRLYTFSLSDTSVLVIYAPKKINLFSVSMSGNSVRRLFNSVFPYLKFSIEHLGLLNYKTVTLSITSILDSNSTFPLICVSNYRIVYRPQMLDL